MGRELIMGFWVFLGLIAAVVLVGISAYNTLVALRQRTHQAFADIDVQLKQRHDLIPNLIETVKGYAAHEKGTLESVVAARNAAMNAGGGASQQAAAEGVLSAALGRLIALAEAYPDLKANTNFQQLQTELTNVENKLAAARRFFNNAVSEYNAAVQAFPAVLFAAAMGFQHRDFFDVGQDDRKRLDAPPEVKF
jgi:LemA protein